MLDLGLTIVLKPSRYIDATFISKTKENPYRRSTAINPVGAVFPSLEEKRANPVIGAVCNEACALNFAAILWSSFQDPLFQKFTAFPKFPHACGVWPYTTKFHTNLNPRIRHLCMIRP